jgi:hypothetical protein
MITSNELLSDVKTQKKVGELRGDIGANMVLTPFENTVHHLQKRAVQLGVRFEDTAFNPGFEIVKF